MSSNSYPAVHQRLRRQRGKATEHTCAGCGALAVHWAYDKTDPNEIHDVVQGHPVTYSIDLERYRPMCQPCHQALDQPAKSHCVNGHALIEVNVYYRPSGGRLCRICRRDTMRAWRAAHPDYRRKGQAA